jgi:hypothetical protein
LTPHRLMWIGLVGVLLLQFAMFRSYAEREIVWGHPTNFDQSGFLRLSYQAFEDEIANGVLHGSWHAVQHSPPTGVMLPLQASLLYYVLGTSRITSLTLLFIYLALTETVLLALFWRLTRSTLYSFAVLAIFLLSDSRYYYAGGIFDFRIDSIAASLYAIFVSLVILLSTSKSKYMPLAAGAAGALLVLFRFAAFAYLTGAIVAYALLVFAFGKFSSRPGVGILARLHLKSLGIVSVTMAILAGPLLWMFGSAIIGYYGGHIGVRKIRATEVGLTDLTSHLIFYPRSLWQSHLGLGFIAGAGLLLCATVFVRWSSRYPREEPRPFEAAPLVFCLVTIFVPLVVLTTDPAKSPVVASILVGPVTLALALAGVMICGVTALRNSRLMSLICCLVIGAGLVHEFTSVSRHSFISDHHTEERRLLDMYSFMADYASDVGWNRIALAVDRTEDYFIPENVSILHYEKTGAWLPPSYTLGGTILAIPEATALEGVRNADFAVLTTILPGDVKHPYPFDDEMIDLESRLWAEARASLLRIRTIEYDGRQLTLFAKLPVEVNGASGTWLMPEGTSLRMPCEVLSGKHDFVAAGNTILPEMLNNKLGVTASLDNGTSTETLPATISPVTATYSITIQTQGAHVPLSGTCAISLTFDHYFVPKERGINQDTRKLVIMAPSQFRVE